MAMTFTYDQTGPIKRIIADWTSDSSGDAAGTTRKIEGSIIKGITDPGATAPTDNYDIVITDPEAVDVLGGCDDDLMNRDTANSEEVYFFVLDHAGTPLAQPFHPAVCDTLTITVSNAGNVKSGQLILYWRAA